MEKKVEEMLLERLSELSWWQRIWVLLKLSGPGYLQSAFTLGSATASACVLAGSKYGYQLLWVHPIAIVMGAIMLSAIAKQTLTTQERPYDVFAQKLHPAMALFWGLGALLASIVWHLPQYALAASVLTDWGELIGISLPPIACGAILLPIATAVAWSYSLGLRGVRVYENLMRLFIMVMLLTVLLVVIQTGIDWRRLIYGFFVPNVPLDREGLTIVLGAMGASVGINMVFLYPYSLLKRQWGKKHLVLAYFDLWTGMVLPFTIVTSLIIIACANTLHAQGIEVKGASDAAKVLGVVLGETFSRVLMGAGFLAMALSTITLQMLTCGFIVCEIFKRPTEGWFYRLAMLTPAIGVIGVIYRQIPFWVGVFTSSIAFLLIPVVYIGVFILHNRPDYMGTDRPQGTKALVWNGAMVLAILFLSGSALFLWWLRLTSQR
ncbi:MAG: Nramp family divalent metal transporter [Armatimonadetes bacterium]|nr:Nramp family divalent metal transporter [Armatimonadota bacterium]MDW8028484.1 Nramp family divalent metal transporter [Armatimonadota bacterium]